jgi:hypothetical protein
VSSFTPFFFFSYFFSGASSFKKQNKKKVICPKGEMKHFYIYFLFKKERKKERKKIDTQQHNTQPQQQQMLSNLTLSVTHGASVSIRGDRPTERIRDRIISSGKRHFFLYITFYIEDYRGLDLSRSLEGGGDDLRHDDWTKTQLAMGYNNNKKKVIIFL